MKKLFIFLFCIISFTSCKTVKVIEKPIENNSQEYIHNTDSIYIQDSIFINQYIKGDTVYKDRYKYKYIHDVKHDTILKKDSIQVPCYITKEKITNELTWWQKTLMWLGIIFIIFIMYKLVKGKI